MTEIEGSSKPERKQLDPEAEQALAQAAIARSENRLRSAFALLPKDRAAADVPLTADSSGDHDSDPAPVVAITGSETHTRTTLPDATTATPASPEPAPTEVLNSMTNTPPAEGVDDGQGTGKLLSQRRRGKARPQKGAVVGVVQQANPTGSQGLLPSEPAPKPASVTPEADPNEIIIKDKQIERLLADYEERPECRKLLSELKALKGTNPDEKAIANIREELKKLAPVVTDPAVGQAPESVQPVRRNVDAPVTDASLLDNISVRQPEPTRPLDAGVVPPSGATSVDVTATGVSGSGEQTNQQATWNKDRLLAEIKEGVVFTLIDSDGNRLSGEYHRKGGKFLKGKNKSKDESKNITKILSLDKGARWERKGATAAVAPKLASADVPDATVPATPAHPDKPVDVSPAPAAEQKKAPEPFLEKEGVVYVFRGTDLSVPISRVVREGGKYYFVEENGAPPSGVKRFSPEEYIRERATEEKWQLVSVAGVLVPGATADPATPTGAPVPPAMPLAPDRASGEKLRFTPLQKDEEAFYQGKKGGVTVKGLGGDWYRVIYPSGTTVDGDGAQVERFAKKDEWVPTVEPPVTQEKQENFDLATGDSFISRGVDGVIRKQTVAATFTDPYGDSWVDVMEEVDTAGVRSVNRTLHPEDVQKILRDGHYVREGSPAQSATIKNKDVAGRDTNENYEPRLGDVWLREKDGTVTTIAVQELRRRAGIDQIRIAMKVTDESGRVTDSSIEIITADDLQRKLKEGFVRQNIPKLDSVVTLDVGKKWFQPVGERMIAVYLTPEGEVEVKAVGDNYEARLRGKDAVLYTQAEIEKRAQEEEWTWRYEKIIPPEEKEAEKNLESLLAEVKEARLAYVRTDYHQKKLWNRITGVFRNLKDKERNDKDTEDAKTRYERALSELFNSQLGELKQLDLTPAELHKKMGEMLMYYKYDEQINLANDRTKVEYENMNLPMKVKKVMEEAGKAYNKLTPTTKIALAVAVLGGAAVAGAAAGAVGAAVGLSVVTVRRVVTTLGAGAALDMLAAQGVEHLRKRSAVKEQKEQMEGLEGIIGAPLTVLGKNEGIPPEMFEQLSKNVADDIASLDRKFQKQKQMKFWRKAAVWGAAVGASAFFTYRSFGGGSGAGGGLTEEELEKRAKAANLRAAAKNVPGTGSPAGPGSLPNTPPSDTRSFQPLSPGSAPLKLDSMPGIAPQDIITPGATEAGTPSAGREFLQATDPSFSADAPVATPESSQSVTPRGIANPDTSAPADVKVAPLEKMGSVLQNYTVESTDGKSGLWSILDGRLPDDIPKGAERNRIIASIENVMRKDLASMTPAEQAAAGFPKGSLDLIYKGGVIQFDKFPSLTEAKLEAIMDGESVGAPHVAEVIDGSSGTPNDIPDSVSPPEKAEILKGFADGPGGPAESVKIPDVVSFTERAEILKGFSDGPGGSVETTRGLGASVVASAEAPSPVPPETTVEMTLSEVTQPANFKEYLELHPEAAHSYKITLNGIKETTFSLPDVMPRDGVYMAQIEGGYQVGIQGQVYMERVFETHQEFRSGVMNPSEYDSRPFPFKSTQVDRLVHLVRAASHPKIFGEAGQVMPGEKVDQYLKRIAALTTVSHKERELAFLLGIGRR